MPTPTRDYPYALVEVYKPAHGDPVLIDPGLAWYDVLASSFGSGLPSVNSSGIAYLEQVEGIGVCCRPFLVTQDTRLSHFTRTGGSWEEERFSAGGARGYRVTQYDSSSTVTSWSATSTYSAPTDAQYAFSLVLPDTPSDWDFTTYPPFIRIELGASYGVQFTKDGSYLMRFVSGAWRVVADIPSPPKGEGWTDAAEVWVYVRVLRSQVCVSTDLGRTYTRYTPSDGAATIPGGKIVLRGRGGSCTFGIHQLKAFAGTWDSQAKPLERSRVAATVTFTGSRYDENGGTVAFTDLGTPTARLAQYRATLTPPTATPGAAFSWYFTPVLYAVNYRIAPTVQAGGTDPPEALPGDLLSVRIVKPLALDGTSATISFAANAYDNNTKKYYRWRKVRIYVGYHLSDGTDETYGPYYFYVADQTTSWSEELSQVIVTWNLLNISARFKRDPWSPFRQVALCGQTPNAAAVEILTWQGLNSSYFSGHSAAATGLIPLGMAEEPCELTTAQEMPWETLRRIQKERFLELAITDAGVITPVPLNYVSATVDHVLRSTAPSTGEDERNTSKSLSTRTDYKESCTSVLVYCKDESGNMVFSGAVDSTAETDATNERFSGWRETRLLELNGTASAGYLLGHAQALAQEGFALKDEADFSIPVDPRHSRRERWALYGFQGQGIVDGTEFVLLTQEINYAANSDLATLTTTGTLRRV